MSPYYMNPDMIPNEVDPIEVLKMWRGQGIPPSLYSTRHSQQIRIINLVKEGNIVKF